MKILKNLNPKNIRLTRQGVIRPLGHIIPIDARVNAFVDVVSTNPETENL